MIGQDISALANSAAMYEKSCVYMPWGIDDKPMKLSGPEYNLQTLKKRAIRVGELASVVAFQKCGFRISYSPDE